MVFASDLDMTLIYSERFLPYDKEDLILAEIKRNNQKAFISKTVFEKLQELMKKGLIFIPTTARDDKRYKNISIFNDIKFPLEITGNGKNIYINGEEDINWKNKMNRLIENANYNTEEVKKITRQKLEEWHLFKDVKVYTFDNYLVIFSFTHRDFFKGNELEKLNELFESKGWDVYCCNRKLYLSISGINKMNALEYIKKTYFPKEDFIVSGDSYSDIDMLKWANHPIVPLHGDVVPELPDVMHTDNKGILASIDIINKVEELMNKEKAIS